jgi:hypothetical protein
MLMIGRRWPTICCTWSLKQPAALTTCSATMVPFSVTTSHSPLGSWLMSVTRLWREISTPALRAPAAMALVELVGSVWPSLGV